MVVGLALLAAGAVSASALGGQPTPDPAPTKTAAPPKTTKTTAAPSKTTKTTAPATVSRPSSHATTTSQPSSTPATAHTSTASATSAHAKTTTEPNQPTTKPKPKPTVVVKRKAKPKTKLVPKTKAPPATHVATPRASPAIVLASTSRGGGSGLARTLLLALAILFLGLAAVPWQQVFQYHVRPDQVLLLRVAFSVISLSVGVGYVIASYVNGGT